MAKFASQLIADAYKKYHSINPFDDSDKTGNINFIAQGLRAWVATRRALSISTRQIGTGGLARLAGIAGTNHTVIDDFVRFKADLQIKKDLAAISVSVGIPDPLGGFNLTNANQALSDGVSIIDIDANGFNKGTEIIKLPFIPKELNYNTESNFAAIRPIGSNTPRYHFTGAEDKLEFEIDWHSLEENRMDVITKCRKLESLAKADGYNGPPHRVILQWGESNLLFADHVFQVIAAPYRLVQFSNGHIGSNKLLKTTNMYPVQAYQKVTLARISSNNLSKLDIESTQFTDAARNLAINLL